MSSTSIIPEALPTAQVSKKSLPTHVHLHAVACMRYYDGGSALDAAASEGNPAIVRLLLENGAKIDTRGPYGHTALWWAINGRYEAIVRLLIDHVADVNEKYDSGECFRCSCKRGKYSDCRLMLHNGAKIDSTGPSSYTALWWAIEGGYEATVQLLIEHGADVNEEYDNRCRSALKEAVVRRHEAIVMLLLRKQDDDRWSLACRKVLNFSIDHQYTEAVHELLEWGAHGIIPTGNALALFEAARDGD
ncbi:hypothetical protein VF21_05670 [Pseudogymnoascus sp. 05NY08]|nr:hypothetical protein VF21_05670 [Pseudogymnoascus sp. 05NY08]